MPRILVVGSANTDVVAPCDRMPRPGETLTGQDIRLVPGGKGANAAVAAARLGGEVRFCGAVGDDAFGAVLRAGLEGEGIDCRWLAVSPGGSGTAVILLDRATAQNSILVGPGANHRFDLPDGDAPFAWADALMLQLEIPLPVALEAARRARAAGKLVVLDPAPAVSGLPEELLRLCDLVSPNETELEILTGLPAPDAAAAERGAAALLRLGAKSVVVKRSRHGALWADAGGILHRPAFPVEAVDTTAAGDAFTGALALALASGRNRETALREALAAGSLACTRLGAQPSLPTRAELDALLAKHP